jgi:hypothetical protein
MRQSRDNGIPRRAAVKDAADKLLVPFAGEGSVTGELSWGQQTIWRGIEARGAPGHGYLPRAL